MRYLAGRLTWVRCRFSEELPPEDFALTHSLTLDEVVSYSVSFLSVSS